MTKNDVVPPNAAPPLQPAGDDRALDQATPRRMLTEKMVLGLIPMARSTLWRAEKENQFPKGVYVLGRKLYYADEVAAFQVANEGQPGGRRNRHKR